MSKEKALAISEETFKIFQETMGISFEEALKKAKRNTELKIKRGELKC